LLKGRGTLCCPVGGGGQEYLILLFTRISPVKSEGAGGEGFLKKKKNISSSATAFNERKEPKKENLNTDRKREKFQKQVKVRLCSSNGNEKKKKP